MGHKPNDEPRCAVLRWRSTNLNGDVTTGTSHVYRADAQFVDTLCGISRVSCEDGKHEVAHACVPSCHACRHCIDQAMHEGGVYRGQGGFGQVWPVQLEQFRPD